MTILFFLFLRNKKSFKSSGDLEERIPSLTLSSFILKSGDIFYCQKSHEKTKLTTLDTNSVFARCTKTVTSW